MTLLLVAAASIILLLLVSLFHSTLHSTTMSSSFSRVQYLLDTETTELQQDTEDECQPFYLSIPQLPQHQLHHLQSIGLVDGLDVCLLYKNHAQYLMTALDVTKPLKSSFASLDASRPWMLYWTLHALDVMNQLPQDDDEDEERVLCACVDTLKACYTHNQGFGGGPGQMAHMAPTYAAVMVLAIIGSTTTTSTSIASQQALEFLNEIRLPLLEWFLSLKNPTGGFRIHHDGEMDVRATYTVLCVASLLGILTPTLCEGTVEFLKSCQTYEGGFGGEPGSEAHGGYTYCAVAALEFLGALEESCNLQSLRDWLVRRQMPFEGGFHGRCNKLVDGCYSFWQGGALAIVSKYYGGMSLYDEGMLQRYILLCAQDLNGGLRDKPSKPRDFYHSCYNLSGLSVSQHYGALEYGHAEKSRVAKTHTCYNIRVERVEAIQRRFSSNTSIVVIEQEEE